MAPTGFEFQALYLFGSVGKGLSPATVVNDAPLYFSSGETGGKAWEPKNYDGKFEGPMSVRRALAKSKNMVSIRVLQLVGTESAQAWVSRFGFQPERHPPYLTMALGAGTVTPMQMATGYSVFANGGYRTAPTLIKRVVEQRGRVLYEAPSTVLTPENRAIDERNAFVMNSLLQEITKTGTAARAQSTLKRHDLFGKTGTTNDSVDAWFVGFQPTLVAAAWVGYDVAAQPGQPRNGWRLEFADLDRLHVFGVERCACGRLPMPPGVIRSGGEWYFEEFGPGRGVRGLGLRDPWPGRGEAERGLNAPPPATVEDRKSILDLFRN